MVTGSTFAGNTYGVHVQSNAAPTINFSNFSGNTHGVQNDTPSTVVNATYNYWGAASGPSGSGPGTGDSVSTGVSYSPFATALTSQPQGGSPASSLTIHSDQAVYSLGQTVTVSGQALALGNVPIPAASVVVTLTLNGSTRTLGATTDASGTYGVQYRPLSTEAGSWQMTATEASGGASQTASGAFRVAGLQETPATQSVDLAMGNSQVLSLNVLNSGNASVNSVNVTVTSNGSALVTGKLNLTGIPGSLIPGSTFPFNLTVNAATGTPPANPVVFTVTATGVDATSGAAVSVTATVTVTLHPHGRAGRSLLRPLPWA